MKVAVTGANGHVGVNLCKELVKRGHAVRAFVHNNAQFIRHLPVEQVRGDILNKDSIKPLICDTDVVFHLAARISITGDRDGGVWKVNADGTRNIVEAAHECGIRKLVHFSSIHAFSQEPSGEMLDESRPLVGDGGFAYDRSKAEGERMVMTAAQDGLDALVLAPTAIIGPEDPQPSLTGKAVLALYRRQIPALVPGGYNFVDVRDVVQAAITASERGTKGEKYLVSGTWRSVADLSAVVSSQAGVRTARTVLPFWVARVGLPFITAYSRMTGSEPLYTGESLQILAEGSRDISCAKAKRDLGYASRSLEETVQDLLSYFKSNGTIQ